MADEYIRREDAVNALEEKEHEPWYLHKDLEWMSGVVEAKDVIKSLEPADVVPVKILKAEIYKLKCQQDSKNQDYYTGYMSALSTVEGILAEMDGED